MLKWLKTKLFKENVKFWPFLEMPQVGYKTLYRLKLGLHVQFFCIVTFDAIQQNTNNYGPGQFNLFGSPQNQKTYILRKLDPFQLSHSYSCTI